MTPPVRPLRATSPARRARTRLAAARPLGALLATAATLTSASTAHARGPYLVVRDDGTLREGRWTSGSQLRRASRTILAAVDDAGLQRPEVLSIWSTFPVKGSAVETVYDGFANDVTNIGLASVYDPETFSEPSAGPVRAALWHNDVTQIARRAAFGGSKPEGYASYLFLLELSHLWGPQLRAPAPTPDALVGFTFHWSFWMDAGGSPAGGNRFRDHGDGTFTVEPRPAAAVTFSMLDLYLMGLASADEVPPVGLLVDPVVPEGVKDPMGQRPVGAATFPWFDGAPFTVRATKRTYTMAELVAANGGPRVPSVGKSSYDVGFVLVVPAEATDEELAAWDAVMTPVARESVARFAEATRGRASLVVTTPSTLPGPAEAGAPEAPDEGGGEGSASPARAAPPAPVARSPASFARAGHSSARRSAGAWSSTVPSASRARRTSSATTRVRSSSRAGSSAGSRPAARARTLGGVCTSATMARRSSTSKVGARYGSGARSATSARARTSSWAWSAGRSASQRRWASPKASSTPGTSLRSGSASPERSRSTAWAARPGVEAARVTRSTSRQGTKRGRRPSRSTRRPSGPTTASPPSRKKVATGPSTSASASAPLRLAPVARAAA